MARRTLNRRELRDAAQEVESDGKPAKTAKKKAAKKKASTAKPRSRSKKAKEAPIAGMKLVWGVFNNSNECVETFEYRDRKKADKLAAQLAKKHDSSHFVKPIKEPMG